MDTLDLCACFSDPEDDEPQRQPAVSVQATPRGSRWGSSAERMLLSKRMSFAKLRKNREYKLANAVRSAAALCSGLKARGRNRRLVATQKRTGELQLLVRKRGTADASRSIFPDEMLDVIYHQA